MPEYSGIQHVSCWELQPYNVDGWEQEVSQYRTNFNIDKDERIIFIRDTTFWGSKNQGLVITDRMVYMIEDNDYPENRAYFSWVLVDNAEFNGDGIIFNFTDGDTFEIPIKYFTKSGGEKKRKIGQMLAEVFSLIGEACRLYQ